MNISLSAINMITTLFYLEPYHLYQAHTSTKVSKNFCSKSQLLVTIPIQKLRTMMILFSSRRPFSSKISLTRFFPTYSSPKCRQKSHTKFQRPFHCWHLLNWPKISFPIMVLPNITALTYYPNPTDASTPVPTTTPPINFPEPLPEPELIPLTPPIFIPTMNPTQVQNVNLKFPGGPAVPARKSLVLQLFRPLLDPWQHDLYKRHTRALALSQMVIQEYLNHIYHLFTDPWEDYDKTRLQNTEYWMNIISNELGKLEIRHQNYLLYP